MSENFNNVAFAHAFSVHKVAFYLVSEQDFVQYALYFSAFWTAWTLSAEYACRYNDVDLGVERRESFFVQILIVESALADTITLSFIEPSTFVTEDSCPRNLFKTSHSLFQRHKLLSVDPVRK